ncbi:hypothetical protein ACFY3M_52980 [Streptomyces mirabilis]|uniref:hypothetical protein n=1 Tax=Streptomyces mirabilis TaxID=68239 RepID=UPI0036A1A688
MREHWSLVFDDPGQATERSFRSGDDPTGPPPGGASALPIPGGVEGAVTTCRTAR